MSSPGRTPGYHRDRDRPTVDPDRAAPCRRLRPPGRECARRANRHRDGLRRRPSGRHPPVRHRHRVRRSRDRGGVSTDHPQRPGAAPCGRTSTPTTCPVVACSHLHFDHAGQNAAFPGRPIHVQAAELAAADGPDYTIRGWVHFPDARYVTHDGETEVLEGVRLVPTPGHTPGHQSLLVDAAEGRTVVAGQAVYTRAEWDGSDGPGRVGPRECVGSGSLSVVRGASARLRARCRAVRSRPIGGTIPRPSRFSDLWGCVVSTGPSYRGTRAEDATGPR